MARRRKPRVPKGRPGTSPGTIHVDPNAPKPVIRVEAYGPAGLVEHRVGDPQELRGLLGKQPVVWVNVDGLGDAATLEQIAQTFGLHRLALEDVVSLGQRPKVEVYDEHLFIVLRMANPADPEHGEQLSMFVGAGYVLTFQEIAGDCFDGVRQRIRAGQGRIRHSGPDYLAYALVDAVIDAYFPVLESLGDRLEALETEVFAATDRTTLAKVQQVKAALRENRRATWPNRDVTSVLLRADTPYVSDATRVYLRDCADHAMRTTELVEVYREIATDLMGVYLSSQNHRMNEVMKFLTIIASIFIPLSFVAGIYGMNFDREASPWNMPELGWAWGYPAVMLVMLLIGVGMLWMFKRKGWLR